MIVLVLGVNKLVPGVKITQFESNLAIVWINHLMSCAWGEKTCA
jgi:hypothetical protein